MLSSAILKVLAKAILAGEQERDAVAARLVHVLGRNWRWVRPLAGRYVETFAGRIRPRRRDLISFLRADFREHLQGRMAFLASINPEKGKRLRAILDQITWE
jgi:hypothetical protein